MARTETGRPAIILGGDENALSVLRNLSRAGIPTYVLNRRKAPVHFSRYGRRLAAADGSETPQDWARFLLGSKSDHLAGAVLFACGDDAIELVADNWSALASKYLLEECPPSLRHILLDKLSTYETAREVGVPVPRFWLIRSEAELRAAEGECRFPVILKPRLSYFS